MALKIIIDYDPASAELIIKGNLEKILSDPGVSLYIRQSGGFKRDSSSLIIPTAEGSLQTHYQIIQELLSRSDVQIHRDEHLAAEIKEIQQAEEDFVDFSNSAKAIWDAEFESEQFEQFAKIIKDKLTHRNPYPLQMLSAYHLAFSQHSCNFSVPGSGKTTIVYAAYVYLHSLQPKNPKYVNHLLVVGPLSAFGPWEKEFKKIFGREPKSKRLSGNVSPIDRSEFLRGITADSHDIELTLTSYPTLANNREEFEYFLKAGSRKIMMVLDEAHYIKSGDGVWSSNALSLAKYPSSRVVLTGTPVPNGYEDLLNLFKFIHPDRDIVGFSANVLNLMSSGKMTAGAVEVLKKNIQPFFTRIKKKDLGLPPIESHLVKFAMDSMQEKIYRYIEEKVVPDLYPNQESLKNLLTRAKLIRLRQAATNPTLLLKPIQEEGFDSLESNMLSISDAKILRAVMEYSPREHSNKLRAMAALLNELRAKHNKVLIWSYFLGNLDLLGTCLQGLFDEMYEIRGATPIASDDDEPFEELNIETRESIIEDFLHSPNSSILVANPQAVGESISLHESCHVAVYYDRDFNAGRFIQSKDRIHRYGLPEGQLTEYYYLIASGTVDEDIHDRLYQKEAKLKELIDSDEIPLFRIALGQDEFRKDIQAILRSYENRKTSS